MFLRVTSSHVLLYLSACLDSERPFAAFHKAVTETFIHYIAVLSYSDSALV